MTSPSTNESTPEDSRIAAAKAAIWDAFLEIYQGAVTGSRELSNRHIALDATLWDVDEPQLIQGLAELERTRDRRVSGDSSLVSISPEPPVIDVWGATALVRHYFEVTLATASGTELKRVRNTSVWREIAGRWVVVHNHEDAIGPRARQAIEGEKSHEQGRDTPGLGWPTVTPGQTGAEIRVALSEGALGYHSLGGSWSIVGRCHYGHHADGIESFLREYGIGVNSEGEFHLLDNDQDVE